MICCECSAKKICIPRWFFCENLSKGLKFLFKVVMDPYSTIPHPGHGTGHHRSGGDTPTTIQFLTTRYMKVNHISFSIHSSFINWKQTTFNLLNFTYFKYFQQHSKSVGILWAVFTVCSAILNIVVFLQEEWVGETSTSKSPGHFGLWRFCTVLSRSSDNSASSVGDTFSSNQPAEEVICIGQLDNFASILSPAFRYCHEKEAFLTFE